MKGWTSRGVWCACVVFALVAGGCDSKPTHESVAKDSVAKMQEFVDVLKTIKDESSAKAAKPKLEKIKKEMDELQKKAKELGDPPPEVKKQLQAKHEKDVQKVMGEMFGEMMRIGTDPKIAPYVKDSMPQMK